MTAIERSTYSHIWRLKRVASSPETVMAGFQENPTQIFPFPMRDMNGGKPSIQEGTLINLRPLLVKREPVKVDYVGDTSFSFRTLPGHWHGEGATITFTVLERDNGTLYLSQKAEFDKKWYAPVYGFCAGIIWYAQAKRLARFSRTQERAGLSQDQKVNVA